MPSSAVILSVMYPAQEVHDIPETEIFAVVIVAVVVVVDAES